MKAHEILEAACGHLKDRAVTYDNPQGERSMEATVKAFNAVTGDGLMNTAERGWLFMVLLKAVRSQQGATKMDNFEDGAAYFALAGEAAAGREKVPSESTKQALREAADIRLAKLRERAPEGATHWGPNDGGWPASFYIILDGVCQAISSIDRQGAKWGKEFALDDDRLASLIKL